MCFTGLHASLTSLKEQEFPSQGSPIGQYSPQEISDHNRCITDRLGSRLGGQVSERQVGTPLVIRAHKCARTEGCSSCSGSPITIICYKHVLIGTDSTSVVYYINHQGGTRSLKCLQVATDLLTWACPQLSSLRAIHIPGTANRAANILSRTGPLPGEWRLHTEVIAQIWARYGTAQVDLFASVETTHCPRWYSLKVQDGSLGLDALSQEWPTDLLYAFPPFSLIPQVLRRIGEGCYMLQDFIHVGQVFMVFMTMVFRDDSADSGSPVAATITGGSPVTNGWPNLASEPNGSALVGMTPAEPVPQQLDDAVRETLNNARAPSTCANYAIKWRIFSEWCLGTNVDPITCSVPLVLHFCNFN